jgi:AcrR family transcriptional regulator
MEAPANAPRATASEPAAAGSRCGPGGKKAEQRRASVERLMVFARQRFIAQGYNATTLEDIAAPAGLSKGAIYFYFKSKANLLLALLDEAERLTVEPAVKAVRETKGSARDQMVAFLHSQSLAGQTYADRMLLIILMSVEMYRCGGEIEERLTAINDTMKKLLCQIVTAGKRDGAFATSVPTKELASVILAVNQGCFLEWYRNSDDMNGHDLVRALRTMVLHGVLFQSN